MNYIDIKSVLTIAGSDSSGGAGIQADIKTILSNGCYAMSAITALTAQNTQDVRAICETTSDFLEKQIDAICDDIIPDAVKIGMVSSESLIRVIASEIRRYDLKNVVVDPVMVSTSGCKLLSDGAIDSLVDDLFPLARVITPNIPEAELLSGEIISSANDMERVGHLLADRYHVSVLMKGGHRVCDANDLLIDGGMVYWFNGIHIENDNTHGTGCTLSSAIASYLAKGYSLSESVNQAKLYISRALFYGINIGKGSGPLNHGWNVMQEEHRSWAKSAIRKALGLYAVTDRSFRKGQSLYEQVEACLQGNATMIQLREKNLDTSAFLASAREIKQLTDMYHVPFIINDNVMVARLVNADGVHIGQDDMDIKTARALLGEEKIIGVSAHNIEEALLAEKNGADYIGVGAVFGTSTKSNTIPVSYEQLSAICNAVTIPVVAIGGICEDNIEQLSGSGISGVAVVSGIFAAEDIKQQTKTMYTKVINMIV